jgi:hypothetical protein
LYRPADSWQVGHRAVFPPVQPTLGVAAALPATCLFGGAPQISGVLINLLPGGAPLAPPPSVASKSRSEKDRDRKRARRACETAVQKEGRLARDRRRASVKYARKQQHKAASGIVDLPHEEDN